jgi:single-strand DNA-binding protein
MADLNEVRLIGRLTRDPELRSISTGSQICNFAIATGKKYKNADGKEIEETTFVDCSSWGKLAEIVNKYCKKGDPVFVGGRLKLETWEDKQSGQKRSKLNVVADNVQFLSSGNKTQSEPEPQQDFGTPPF